MARGTCIGETISVTGSYIPDKALYNPHQDPDTLPVSENGRDDLYKRQNMP